MRRMTYKNTNSGDDEMLAVQKRVGRYDDRVRTSLPYGLLSDKLD